MKISKLIKILNKILEEQGDCKIVIQNCDSEGYWDSEHPLEGVSYDKRTKNIVLGRPNYFEEEDKDCLYYYSKEENW